MSFGLFSGVTVLLGALALAGVLFGLQFLRPRVKVVQVATALFWQQAQQQAPLRTLWQRFRYPLAWLLSVIIALAIWLALAGIQSSANSSAERHIYYLDGSVSMQVGKRFSNARTRLINDLEQNPGAAQEVWFGGVTPSLIAGEDASAALIKARLESLTPQSTLTAISEFARRMAVLNQQKSIVIAYYGMPLRASQFARLPQNVKLIQRFTAPAVASNWGIVNFGYRAAASGDPQRVDVIIEITGDTAGSTVPELSIDLDGTPFTLASAERIADNTWLLSNLALTDSPGKLSVRLHSDDDFAADNSATLTLPAMPRITVYTGEGVPLAMSRLVNLTPRLTAVAQNAQVAVCLAEDENCFAQGLTHFLFAKDAGQEGIVYKADSTAAKLAISQLWQRQGWTAEQSLAALSVNEGEQRSVLFSLAAYEALSKNQDRRLPGLLVHSLYWLTPVAAASEFAAVGEPLPTLSESPLPLSVGEMIMPEHAEISVSLLNRTVTDSMTQPSVTEIPSATVNTHQIIWPWLILLALFLVLAEWLAIVRGRLP
ncbi:BatA domain-containing protein [Alteromonas lipolytica]|uniref:Aerotolerance regulator N-terminal domain-containing protein n=1 Tax=Alteromonas lipolytica TaxID=1856405 RepID=A0A1E8FE13_9ALTE|nr:BatA domain-containing protein [Alteromonas lipolytica]OFI34175.1 hypothetical protein BFC17_21805 [Alteromonas lipolytica]GGF84392.1 hypothetical protein GCM10011338_40890 [Alteromonas lipolytica]